MIAAVRFSVLEPTSLEDFYDGLYPKLVVLQSTAAASSGRVPDLASPVLY